MPLGLLLWLDDRDGREGGTLRTGRLLRRFFRFLEALFLILRMEDSNISSFDFGRRFSQPFESAQTMSSGITLRIGVIVPSASLRSTTRSSSLPFGLPAIRRDIPAESSLGAKIISMISPWARLAPV